MQPNLPDMPPMKGVDRNDNLASSAAPPMSAQAPRAPYQGKGRLRQMIGYIAGGGVALVAFVALGELTLRPGLRPTDFLATIEARTELGIFNQKLGAAPGEMVITEDEYRSTLAEAEREGAAKAEIVYQRELAAVQADKERVIGAYQTLFQRTNIIAQAGLQMESVAQQFRQRLLEMSNGGRNVVIMVKDFACGLGDAQACASARNDREVMISESDELSRGDVGAKIRELMAGIDDPATLIKQQDQRQHGTPGVQR